MRSNKDNIAVIYIRTSTDRDHQKNSLENQEALLKEKLSVNGWEFGGMYVDGGISGATQAKRGGIQELIEGARKKKFGVVLAKSVSRLGRNMRENLNMAHELESLGLRLVLPEDDYDSLTNRSKLSFHLKSMLAEEESAKMSERIKLGKQSSALRGKVLASLPPFGYRKNVVTGLLELDEEYAPIARKIYDLYLYEGWGWFKITHYLNQRSVPTPRKVSGARNAGEMWLESSIRVILKNIVYTGKLVQHREETIHFITKKRRDVPEGKQIIKENAHPSIVTPDEYRLVQEKMRSKGVNKSNGQESLFAHIAVCGDCGKGMVHRKDRGKGYGAYVCGGYARHTRTYCTSHLICANELLNVVKDDLRELFSNNLKLERVYRSAVGEIEVRSSKHDKELERAKRRLAEITNEFQSLFQLYNAKAISIEQFQWQNEKLIEEQRRGTQQKLELEQRQELKKDADEQIRQFQQQVGKIANMDIDNERVLKLMLQKLVERVEVNADGSIKQIRYNLIGPASQGA